MAGGTARGVTSGGKAALGSIPPDNRKLNTITYETFIIYPAFGSCCIWRVCR